MPGKKKLDEEYVKLDKEEIKKKEEKHQEVIKEKINIMKRMKLNKLRNDVIYTIIISVMLGFILWSFKPESFTFPRALALGLAWYLLFDDLMLQRLFKKE